MEAKLKSLRVADLRELLHKASVPIPAKSNKSDLIAKVLASPAALQIFDNQSSSAPVVKPKAPESSQAGQDDDLLAPPEEFDWGSASAANGGTAPSSTAEAATSVTAQPTNTTSAVSITLNQPDKKRPTQPPPQKAPSTTPSSNADPGKIDEELEKRKKRAARFGVPFVEAKLKATSPANGDKASPRPAKLTQTAEDTAKLEARAARFGMPATSANKSLGGSQKKRARSPAPVDPEEIEKRRKRSERFSGSSETKAQA